MNALFRFFRLLGCHQLPERSFFFRGKQFPLCARCTGVFLGYALGAVLFAFGAVPPLWMCAAALLPPLLDWGAQFFFGVPSSNPRRLITGLVGGWGLISLMIAFAVSVISGMIWALNTAK